MAKEKERLLRTTRCTPSTVGKSMSTQDKVVYRIQPEDNTESLALNQKHEVIVRSIFGRKPHHSY